jgi:outer membrane protein
MEIMRDTIGRGRLIGAVIGTVLAWTLCIIPAVHAADSVKIGYVDAQKILDNTKAGKKSKESMEEFVKSRQKIIDLDESEIKQLQDDLTRQAAVLSPDARREKEESLQRKVMEYQRRAGDLNKEVQMKKKEVLDKFNNDLEAVVKKVAERSGYSFVIDRNAEGGVLLYAKESFNLTDEVVKEFEKASP